MTVDPGQARAGGYGPVNSAEQMAMSLLQRGGFVGGISPIPTGKVGTVTLNNQFRVPLDPGLSRVPGAREAYAKSNVTTLDRAISMYEDLTPDELREWSVEVSRRLQYDVRKNPEQMRYIWAQNMESYANYQAQTGDTETGVVEYLRKYNDKLSAAGLAKPYDEVIAGGGGAYRGPVTTRSTDQVIDLTNPSQAQMLIDDSLNKYLGRNATEEERTTFYDALNKLERKNPRMQESVQTITPKGDALRVSKGKTVTSGGIDPRVVAEEFAASRPEAAESVASTQYMDWFMEKLRQEPMEGLEIGA